MREKKEFERKDRIGKMDSSCKNAEFTKTLDCQRSALTLFDCMEDESNFVLRLVTEI
jgi:hypothetical protein